MSQLSVVHAQPLRRRAVSPAVNAPKQMMHGSSESSASAAASTVNTDVCSSIALLNGRQEGGQCAFWFVVPAHLSALCGAARAAALLPIVGRPVQPPLSVALVDEPKHRARGDDFLGEEEAYACPRMRLRHG